MTTSTLNTVVACWFVRVRLATLWVRIFLVFGVLPLIAMLIHAGLTGWLVTR